MRSWVGKCQTLKCCTYTLLCILITIWGQRKSMVDQVLSVWEWNQGHTVTRRAHIQTGAAYLKPRPLSKLQTLRTKRDAQGRWNARVELGLALGKGCRQERLLTFCVPPTMEMLGALPGPSPPLSPTPHFGLWNFQQLCFAEAHFWVYWAEEMETLRPDSHLPILRKSPKQPPRWGLSYPSSCPSHVVKDVPIYWW